MAKFPLTLSPNLAWLFLFLPALGYYMTTRLHSWGLFRSNSVGVLMETRIEALPLLFLPPPPQQQQQQQQKDSEEGDCTYLSQHVLYLRPGNSNSNSNTPGTVTGTTSPQIIASSSSSASASSSSASASSTACPAQITYKPLYRVLPTSGEHTQVKGIVATTWKHDAELGRGYLLVSSNHEKGTIWQWETGGGPIPIGRTLNLQDSGCRSNLKLNCTTTTTTTTSSSTSTATTETADGAHHPVGSGGIVVDHFEEEQPRLIVAEWGEQRIVRLEPTTGARTPLVLEYPSPSHNGQSASTSNSNSNSKSPQRVWQPRQLFLTAFGDLMVLDSSPPPPPQQQQQQQQHIQQDTLWQVPLVHTIPPLESLAESRVAHAWTSLIPKNRTTTATTTRSSGTVPAAAVVVLLPKAVLQQRRIGGLAPVKNQWTQLYVTMTIQTDQQIDQGDEESSPPPPSIVLTRVSIGDDANENDDDDDDDNDNENENDGTSTTKETFSPQSELLLDYTDYASRSGPVVVDDQGHLYLAVDDGILIVKPSLPNHSIVGRVSMLNVTSDDHNTEIVSMTLGEDRFLYIATDSSLYRMRVRNGPLKIPTDLRVKG